MKKLLVGLLVLGSLSSFADCIEITQKTNNDLKDRNGVEVEVLNMEVISGRMKMSSRVICGNANYGSYLYVDTGNTKNTYKIRYKKECEAIVEAIQKNPEIVYRAETDGQYLTKISKDQVCEGEGRVILDL